MTVAALTRVAKRKSWNPAFNAEDGSPTPIKLTCWHQDMPFPKRRPIHRTRLHKPTEDTLRWFGESRINVGTELTNERTDMLIALLVTWRDLFVEKLRDLRVTDLVHHTITTYPEARLHRAKDPIYAADEIRWQSLMFPDMVQSGIVRPGTSPWVAKTTWVSKKETVVDHVGR